jgi:hypothetical protein
MDMKTKPRVAAIGSRPVLRVAAVLLSSIAFGLLSRRYPLPGVFAEYTGDALYCVAAFFGMALLFGHARTLSLAVLAFGLSVIVEFTQLLTWPWLGDLRATGLGKLVLGSGFKWPDIVAYFFGAVAAAMTDVCLFPRSVQ